MRHEKKLIQAMIERGYVHYKLKGFEYFSRSNRFEPGVVQGIRVFQWANPKHANQTTIPRSYYCVDLYLNEYNSTGRYRIPLVEWDHGNLNPPPTEQVFRPFEEVMSELDSTLLKYHDMRTKYASSYVEDIPERNRLHHD